MNKTSFAISSILIKCYQREQLSSSENNILQAWLLEKNGQNKQLFDELMAKEGDRETNWLASMDQEKAWERIQHKRKPQKRKTIIWSAAAMLAVVFASAVYWYIGGTSKPVDNPRYVESTNTKYKNDVLPANLGAHIILANGEEIAVSDTLRVAVNGNMMSHGETEVIPSVHAPTALNTLVVPAANFFKISLADGTNVWVNSSSELRFPAQFAKNERRVFLKGEAYFEVAKDASKPFYVETGDMKVRVLGTHFNVSAYEQRNKTTLLEGSVEVTSATKSVVIAPGQSAEWTEGSLRVRKANLQKVMAWKNNEFFFQEDNIVSIANQLKQWYDLDISLTKEVSLTETYSGEIRRDVRLSEVLKMLEFVSKLDFTLDKNKLLITKNKRYGKTIHLEIKKQECSSTPVKH